MHIYPRAVCGREMTPRLRDLTGKIESSDMKNAEEEFTIQLTLGCRGSSRTTDVVEKRVKIRGRHTGVLTTGPISISQKTNSH